LGSAWSCIGAITCAVTCSAVLTISAVQLTHTQIGGMVQLHGTCLGFEALAIIVSGDMKILSSFDSYDNASPLVLTEDGQSGSAFFGSLPRELLQAVQEEPLAMENHGRGPCLQLPPPHLKTKFTCQCIAPGADGGQPVWQRLFWLAAKRAASGHARGAFGNGEPLDSGHLQ